MASQRVIFKEGRAVKKYVDGKEVSLSSKKRKSSSRSSSKSVTTSPDVSDFGSRRGTAVKYDPKTGMTSYIENGRVVLEERKVAMWHGGAPAVPASRTTQRYVEPTKTKAPADIIPSTFKATATRGTTEHSIYKPDVSPDQSFVQQQIRQARTTQPTSSSYHEVIKQRTTKPQSTMTAAKVQPGMIGKAARQVEGYLQKKGVDYHTVTRSVHPFAVSAGRTVRGAVVATGRVASTLVRGSAKLSSPYQAYSGFITTKQIAAGTPWIDTHRAKLAYDPDVWTTAATGATIGAAVTWKAAAVGMEVAGVGFGAHGVTEGLKQKSPEGIGEAIIWGIPTITSGIKLGKMAARSAEFAGATFVPEAEVWGSKVLAGQERFPLVKSTTESFKMAETTKTPEGKYVLVSAGDQPFMGTTAGVGGKASQIGIQDPGVYTFVKGSGSPEFTGIKPKSTTEIKFSLWDTKIDKPTLTEFEVAGVTRPSKTALETPGFEGVVKWQQSEVVGTGYAHVSKRSMLGQSEIPKQKFKTKEGKSVLESGTTEGEFIIPPGSKWSPVKTQQQKTTFKGEGVIIKRMKVLTEKEFKGLSQSEQFSLLKKQKSYREAYSSIYSKPTKTVSIKPVSYVSRSVSKSSSYKSSSKLSSPTSSSRPTSSPTSTSIATSMSSYVSKPTSTSKPISKPVSSRITSYVSKPGYSKTNYYNSKSYVSKTNKPITTTSKLFPDETKKPTPLPRIKTDKPKKKKDLFDVFVRRKGVFSKVGQVMGQASALALGKQKVSTSLAASFKVLKSSTGQAIKTNGLGKTIRQSKREEGVFVQKRTYRLSAGKEKSEIQQAKKTRIRL